MSTLFFFGDSWPAEDGEYENITQQKHPSYPDLVGQLLDRPVRNLAVQGTSQPHMIHQLLGSQIQRGDHAVFSLTAPSRRFYIDHDGNLQDLAVDHGNPDAVNDYQDVWLSALTCYTLQQWCHQHGIKPWFMNTFDVCYHPDWHHDLWHSLDPAHWILPRDQCVVALMDPEFFHDYHNGDFQRWLDSERDAVQHYIRPCLNHPNLRGRQFIANVIAGRLRDVILV